MSLIEGIGDEVTNFYIIVISAIVLYFAWRSTNVRDERIPSRGTIDIYRRRLGAIDIYRRRLLDQGSSSGQHPVTISIRMYIFSIQNNYLVKKITFLFV